MVTITPLNSMLDRMTTLSRAMDQAFSPAAEAFGNGSAQPAWVPSLDAFEDEHSYVVQLDLPGVSAENVEITFERNILTVRGTRARSYQSKENGETRVFFAERDWGTFSRTLRFPYHIEGEKIEATFVNGVLTVTIPKAEAAKPRKISISTGVEAKQLNQ